MAIQGIEQPEVMQIDEYLRLRRFDGVYDFALEWYQDEETVFLVDGVKNTYTPERLQNLSNTKARLSNARNRAFCHL